MKIGYFTAGAQPTANETAEITSYVTAGHTVCVRNVLAYSLDSHQPGADSAEDFDYVDAYAGTTIPEPYDDAEDFPVASPSAPPASHALPGTQMLISSGVEFLSPAPTGSRTDGYTPTIANNAISAIVGS